MSKLITNQTKAWESDMTSFIKMLEAQWAQGKHLCVGLDPVFEKLPKIARTRPGYELGDIESWLQHVINQTASVAAAFKPNTAFFEHYGAPGFQVLESIIGFAKRNQPDVPIILDAKRGDIGNTNEHYARMAFDVMGADAITIHPYLGWEANKPFLDRADKGVIVLCRTSNPGAGEFQDLVIRESKKLREKRTEADIWKSIFGDYPDTLYELVALNVSNSETWNRNGNCCLVAGGTYPEEIAKIRQLAPDIPLLIPGIGKQGGDLEASVKAAKHRFLINSSSGIIFADDPGREAFMLHAQIEQALWAMVYAHNNK